MRVIVKVISHMESRDLGTMGVPLDMPHVIKMIAHSSHGATIHMRTHGSRVSKEGLGGLKQ